MATPLFKNILLPKDKLKRIINMEKNFIIMTEWFWHIYKVDNSHYKAFLKIAQTISHGVQ